MGIRLRTESITVVLDVLDGDNAIQ